MAHMGHHTSATAVTSTIVALRGVIAQKRLQINHRNSKTKAARVAKADCSVRSCVMLEELCWPTLHNTELVDRGGKCK